MIFFSVKFINSSCVCPKQLKILTRIGTGKSMNFTNANSNPSLLLLLLLLFIKLVSSSVMYLAENDDDDDDDDAFDAFCSLALAFSVVEGDWRFFLLVPPIFFDCYVDNDDDILSTAL